MILARFATIAVFLISSSALASPFCDRAALLGNQSDKDACLAEFRSKLPQRTDPDSHKAWLAVMRLNIRAIAREAEIGLTELKKTEK